MTEMITIERAEYDRLVALAEDAEDNAAVAAHLREPEAGMPADLVKRMIAGESPLAVHREWRGLSQTGLAKASAVHRVQIADIEAGRRNGSVETMRKLADALDVAIDDLV
ncbi:helix-turn-helix transcriptional regulator [Pseudoroseicyclus aestuarii]|uniref:DNA-binding XRE family transcriptional regulator n=1 Tax=Pseudoroseicyclus aestuarii TaxID=1795041 RepID=A0A318SM83_9RHOB|nr:helix-turn-helix transcriptional regulator [Pseudoroseicyclus aestuarii]PYE80795.1 DNA-binding XRE family transcriptional regulator [Pseudoroseicyclus aestuarii]